MADQGRKTITIELTVDPYATAELAEALKAACRYAHQQHVDCPLRSDDPETRRYLWTDVHTALVTAVVALAEA